MKPTAMKLVVLKQLVECGSMLNLIDMEAKFEKAN